MKKIGLVLLIFFLLVTWDLGLETLIYAQEETLTLLTYYPAPYGVYDQMQAITYMDKNDTNYYLDLDSISKIKSLNIGVPTSNNVEKAVLQIGDTLPSSSNDKASIYAKTISIGNATVNNYAAIFGETNGGGLAITFYGIQGESHSDTAGNIGVYGKATGGSSAYDDIGVFGKADDCGIVGGLAKVGIAGVFGKDTAYALPDFNCAVYGLGQDVTVGGTSKKAHGIYSKTVASDKYAGYFENTSSATETSGMGIYAYSTAHNGIVAGSYPAGHKYGGVFVSDSKGILLENESSSLNDPEITCGNAELSILISDRSGGTEAKFTVIASDADGVPYNRNAILRVQSYYTTYTSVDTPLGPIMIPMETPRRYIEFYCDDDDSTYSYIRADRAIQIEPCVKLLSLPAEEEEKKVTVMGTIKWNGSVPPPAAKHTYVADIAEPFELTDKEELKLGDIVEVDKEKNGYLRKSSDSYVKTIGIISDENKAAMVIGYRKDGTNDKPIALAGRVLCNADAGYGEIKLGDILVCSPTPGYAMKAKPIKEINGQKIYGHGIIIGKALQSLKEGKGQILVLVMR